MENKDNLDIIDYSIIYNYFLSNEYTEWLKRIFIYPLDYQKREIATIKENMGLDFLNLEIFIIVIKNFLKENNSDVSYLKRNKRISSYTILKGSSFITIDVLEDLNKEEKNIYKITTSGNIDILTKQTISLDSLKEYAYNKLNKEERSR